MILRKNKRWENKKTSDEGFEGKITFIPVTQDLYLNPVRSVEVIPEWYKKLPATDYLNKGDVKKDLTIKRCIPVLDTFTAGYYLTTTFDYHFTYNAETNESKFTAPKLTVSHHADQKTISHHPIIQLGDMPFGPEYIKFPFKWNNPFIVKTPPGYSCLFTQPLNRPDLPFYCLTGIVDTDTYFQPVLFPFFMKNNFEGTIPAGTPIMQIIPFKRDDWKMEIVDQVPNTLLNNFHNESMQYESGRYDSEGNVLGGMYKRNYRKKKSFL
jgi:hypothetical protein